MNFLVLKRIGLNGRCEFLLLQNLYKSFGCPEGFFIVERNNFGCVKPIDENICNIAKADWEKCLINITEQQKNDVLDALK